ncbi:hypothetical protein GCM10008955_21880 [Deinococcus malanensis]|uniref:ATP-binding protein n=1 Tax=Deinococcus malanensis TaxID=1706855 RepID=A0ABQ2EW42_9DEIO|nr:AAA family ATPase [Deinococcus malanensis]GGK27730.1 hypothetical protein GCM10008955_21880 [Deinococcus malanensis]
MRASSPLLLAVSGLPASGKTFLGSWLARELQFPLVTKDEYKQILHEHLPDLSRAQSGPLSFAVMWQVADVILRSGGSLVLESHFYRPVSETHILELARAHGARLAQVYCEAPLAELKRRHAGRVASGQRPYIDFPFDHETLPDSACWHPLMLNAPLLRLDTTVPDSLHSALAWTRQQKGETP